MEVADGALGVDGCEAVMGVSGGVGGGERGGEGLRKVAWWWGGISAERGGGCGVGAHSPTLELASVSELRVVDLPLEGLPTRPIRGSRGMVGGVGGVRLSAR